MHRAVRTRCVVDLGFTTMRRGRGSNDRLFDAAGEVPILLYAQLVGLLRWNDVSLDLTYTLVVRSLTLGITGRL